MRMPGIHYTLLVLALFIFYNASRVAQLCGQISIFNFNLMLIGSVQTAFLRWTASQKNVFVGLHRGSNVMSAPHMLCEIISEDVRLILVEPGIYSIYPSGVSPGSYDTIGASMIYDLVACNRLYNWLMWGYSVKEYDTLCQDSLSSSSKGWVLDLACGSLAFTAKTYAGFSNRPVVFLDQSLKLLRKAKSRLGKIKGNIPENMFFLHADALDLPFNEKTFQTIISLNLLHCVNDLRTVLRETKRVLTINGKAVFTTLVLGSRWSNRYLDMLAGSGALISRSREEVLSAFNDVEMKVALKVKGNLAFIK